MSNGQTNLVDETTAVFVRRIVSQEWVIESRIPTERALTDSEGVARSTVRSALDRLQAWGMIQSRQGSGTFVRPEIQWRVGSIPARLQVHVEDEDWDAVARMLIDSLGLRRSLVLGMLARAATRVRDEEIPEAVEATHLAWAARKDPVEFLRRDHVVLQTIMVAAGLHATLALINEIRRTYEIGVLMLSIDFEVPKSYVPAHLDAVLAVCAGDAEGAVASFEDYLKDLDSALATALPSPLAEKMLKILGGMS